MSTKEGTESQRDAQRADYIMLWELLLTDGSLENTKKEPGNDQSGEILGGSSADGDGRPGNHVEHDPVFDGEDNESVSGKRLTDELGNVDDGREPRVLRADQASLGLEVEHWTVSTGPSVSARKNDPPAAYDTEDLSNC